MFLIRILIYFLTINLINSKIQCLNISNFPKFTLLSDQLNCISGHCNKNIHTAKCYIDKFKIVYCKTDISNSYKLTNQFLTFKKYNDTCYDLETFILNYSIVAKSRKYLKIYYCIGAAIVAIVIPILYIFNRKIEKIKNQISIV